MTLTRRIEAFNKNHFDIDSINDVVFYLDTKNNLVAKFEGREYILTNQRNNEFLSYKTMKFKKGYDSKFLRAIKLEGPKKSCQIKKKKKKKAK